MANGAAGTVVRWVDRSELSARPLTKGWAMRGKMLWFNDAKDIGAICAEDGEHLTVHGGHFVPGAKPTGRCGGTVVDFRLVEDEAERRAVDVALVPEVAAGRARQRHSPRIAR